MTQELRRDTHDMASSDHPEVDRAEFDRYANGYSTMHRESLRNFSGDLDYFADYKVEDAAKEVAERGASSNVRAVLDFGAGCGNSIGPFKRHFPAAALTCADVSGESLSLAEAQFPGMAEFVLFDGKRLQISSDSIDLAFSACVFHHIDPADHPAQLGELHRVLRRDGLLMIFEHNPRNPLTVAVVNRCPFDANAHLIGAGLLKKRMEEAGFADVVIRYRVFFPTILRHLRFFERFLTWLPLGGQYYAIGRKRVLE